jgi:hypothetical protein
MIESHARPGYTAIEAASKLAADAPEWEPFIKDVLGMPVELLRSVQRVIQRRLWMRVHDPLECVRTNAERDYARWRAGLKG